MEDDELNLNEEDKEICEVEVNNLNMWLYLKDRFNISNEAWHELSMKSEEPPCLSKLLKHMNSQWNLKPTPGESEGIQISFTESI